MKNCNATEINDDTWEKVDGVCPHCGGHHVLRNKLYILTSLPPKFEYLCTDCHKNFYSTERFPTLALYQNTPKTSSGTESFVYVPPTNIPTGWVCPKCGRVYSPDVTMCPYCGNFNIDILNVPPITIS